MMNEGTRAPVPGAPAVERARTRQALEPGRVKATSEARLLARVHDGCGSQIAAACAFSSVPPAFLAALTANESGGNPRAARFEPAVYRHLVAVVSGARPRYAGITDDALAAEIADMLHPKAAEYHARYLTPPFDANHQRDLAALPDEALRELATSWGYTQIMGYHMVARAGTVRDLLEPARHFRIALELLAEFIEEFQLDPTREFAEMFCCWNTGQPYAHTFDPHYVERGLGRMDLYARVSALRAPQTPQDAKRP